MGKFKPNYLTTFSSKHLPKDHIRYFQKNTIPHKRDLIKETSQLNEIVRRTNGGRQLYESENCHVNLDKRHFGRIKNNGETDDRHDDYVDFHCRNEMELLNTKALPRGNSL